MGQKRDSIVGSCLGIIRGQSHAIMHGGVQRRRQKLRDTQVPLQQCGPDQQQVMWVGKPRALKGEHEWPAVQDWTLEDTNPGVTLGKFDGALYLSAVDSVRVV